MRLSARALSFAVFLACDGQAQTVRSVPVRAVPASVSVQTVRLAPTSVSVQPRTLPSLLVPGAPGLQADTSLKGVVLGSPDKVGSPVSAAQLQLPFPVVPVAAPENIPAPADLGTRVRLLNEAVAVPLQTAGDAKASPDASRGAGETLEDILLGRHNPPAQEDLPPAGPVSDLTDSQISWLRGEFVTGPRPILTEQGFRAFVEGDAAAMAEVMPWLRNERQALQLSLKSMMDGLRRVTESGLPEPGVPGGKEPPSPKARAVPQSPEGAGAGVPPPLTMGSGLPPAERSALGQALNDRLARTVLALSLDPGLKPKQKRVLAEVHSRFLDNRAALFELTHYLQTVGTLKKLDSQVHSLLAPAPQPSPGTPPGSTPGTAPAANTAPVEHPWNIKPAPPKDQRGLAKDGEVSLVNKTADWASTIKQWQFLVEKHLARYRIAVNGGRFSKRIKDSTAQTLVSILQDYQRKAGVLFSGVERIASYSLHNTFIAPEAVTGRQRGIVWVPDNKNLRLVPEPGGYAVKASFETDIQDDGVLRSVKESIEEYWQGDFEFQGRPLHFRAEVSLAKLAPGAAFSQGALTIRDNAKWLSLAGPGVILLSRELHYATPAHEFGHTMGLADEYRNGYDPQRMASVELQNPASIMSSLSGKVLPRHLKLAFLLLKRKSLASGN